MEVIGQYPAQDEESRKQEIEIKKKIGQKINGNWQSGMQNAHRAIREPDVPSKKQMVLAGEVDGNIRGSLLARLRHLEEPAGKKQKKKEQQKEIMKVDRLAFCAHLQK
jgi:hypothetical protein